MTTTSLLEKTKILKRRTSSTVPFGYELSTDSEYLQPVEEVEGEECEACNI